MREGLTRTSNFLNEVTKALKDPTLIFRSRFGEEHDWDKNFALDPMKGGVKDDFDPDAA